MECKRVGVEEGQSRGPQTIEKAKQGSYVAKTVSSLQKIRLRNGQSHGIIEQLNGQFCSGSYRELQRKIINAKLHSEFPGFVLTIGIISNHGNWFTSENQNKELRVLAQSYDWLLFLTDNGLAKFIDDLLLNPIRELKAISAAFSKSYSGNKKGNNRFTKVLMDAEADLTLQKYFSKHKSEIENWYNIITPQNGTLQSLNDDLKTLANRDL